MVVGCDIERGALTGNFDKFLFGRSECGLPELAGEL